ncbi:MAG: hypothetical protein NVS9B1_02090 [Candidatus Dormibacteraceae bacterium]
MLARIRYLGLTFAAVAALGLGVAQPVMAADTPNTVGYFQFVAQPTITSIRFAGPDLIVEETTPAVIGGSISGAVTFTETDVIHPDHSFTFHGLMTCDCTVAGRSGRMLINVAGSSAADGASHGHFEVVDARGGLAGLTGEGTLAQTPAQAAAGSGTYSGDLRFTP